MGWVSWETNFKGIIADRIAPQESEHANWTVIAHCFRGNPITGGCLWYVVKKVAKIGEKVEMFIALDLIRRRGRYNMAYKDMDESVHPYYYSCPLKYLDMVPVSCQSWRDKVIEYHKNVAMRRNIKAAMRIN